MLSKEEIDAFKTEGFTFEEIQKIQNSLESIEKGNITSQEEMKNYINNELFAKYKIYV